ncbi:MAG: hypothetical protein P4L57_13425 [Rhizomicrobium sp.]|nr:hypothetical protein [Rhizomicrobium sp.]
MQQSRTLVLASMVILLVLLALRGHFGSMPMSNPWSNTAATTVSVRLAAHMAELQIRHALATVGRFVIIR